jgi:hypothetical protein
VLVRGPDKKKYDFSWDNLTFRYVDLDGIDALFSKEEVKGTISKLPSDKAPVPMVLSGLFSRNVGI